LKFEAKKLIIFDLDGTLIDSVPDLVEAINQMQLNIGRTIFEENIVRSWVGNGAETLVKRALSSSVDIDENLDETLYEKALALFLASYKKNACVKTEVYPYVNATLQTFQEKGYIMAIVTNKPYAFVEPILKALDMKDFFALYLGGDSLKVKKPDAQPLLHVCKELRMSVEDSVMVGDSKNDILAANAANMQSIAVNYGYNYGEDISIHNPDIIVDDFAEILECFA